MTETLTQRSNHRQLDARTARSGEPSFPVGGPANRHWRESALTRIDELSTLVDWLRTSGQPHAETVYRAAVAHLDAARQAAERRRSGWLVVNGSNVERAMSRIDAAEADVLRLAPLDYLAGQLPSLVAHVQQNLPANDPRRLRIERIVANVKGSAIDEVERNVIVSAVRVASAEARRVDSRVRSFRNVLLITAAVLTVAAVGLGILGVLSPQTVPVCFRPDGHIVCPTNEDTLSTAPGATADALAAEQGAAHGGDVLLVELLGLVAAGIAGAAALRGIRGTSTPYSLPIALAVLKLPTGALTAFLGLMLMRGEFVPGLSALDSAAQILAWAIVFGYAQQLFTRFVDAKGQEVLDAVGGPGIPAPA